MDEPGVEIKRRRGIFLLPNLFTTAALFAGFYAILASTSERYEAAAVAIFVAMIMDGLDGRVARLTNTQSAFGAEYDSLSDMTAFGLAPALVMYHWALHGLGKIGWLAAFVYTAGTALRLARFNTQIGVADKRFFQGLPSPAAAAIMAASVWIGDEYAVAGADVGWLVCILTVTIGLLMVSNFRYHSFKEFDIHNKVPFLALVAIMLGFGVIYIHPPLMMFLLFLVYAVSGPVMSLGRWRRTRVEAKKPGAGTDQSA